MKKVITYGTFDLFHQGHINLLKKAKSLGEYLIVGVTSESYDSYRGKMNVRQTLIQRIENVKASGFADEILVEEYEGQKIDDIQKLGISIFTIGSDWINKFDYLREYCQVVYLQRTKGISSTQLRDEIDNKIYKMGIVGCGRIAKRFLMESKYVSGINISGVFGIHENSTKNFCDMFDLDFFELDYNLFLEKVDSVYIASPHGTHYNYIKNALSKNCHVLCEKPMVLKEKEAVELFRLAKSKRLILMEALKTAYSPGFLRLLSLAKSGRIGEIKHIETTFTKLAAHGSRELSIESDGGSMYELGSYPLLAISKFLGHEYLECSFSSLFDSTEKVDLFTSINLNYKDSIANAKVGLGVKSSGELIISGTRGYILVPAPWWKTNYFEMHFEDEKETERFFYKFLGDGLRYELVQFLDAILSKNMNENAIKTSIFIASMMERFSNEKIFKIT